MTRLGVVHWGFVRAKGPWRANPSSNSAFWPVCGQKLGFGCLGRAISIATVGMLVYATTDNDMGVPDVNRRPKKQQLKESESQVKLK
jgi:hypothetical protein